MKRSGLNWMNIRTAANLQLPRTHNIELLSRFYYVSCSRLSLLLLKTVIIVSHSCS
jgi:hypothetical protein